jgi:xylulokinase
MNYILAHDFGTSGAKASLFRTDGSFVTSATTSYVTHHPKPEYAEQDADDWWDAFCKNNRSVLSAVDKKDVLCVSFSGTYPNCLLVDSEMKPLRRAMIWQDVRSVAEAKEISGKIPKSFTARSATGTLLPDRTLCQLMWTKKYCPDVLAQAAKILPSAGSYICLKLTGTAVCDFSVAYGTSMIERGAKDWSDEVLSVADVSRKLMPSLFGRTDVIGTVTAAIADECCLAAGTKVVVGTEDTACTYIGGGLRKPGDVLFNGGTSAEIVALLENGKKVGRPSSSSGASMKWLKDSLCVPESIESEESGENVFAIIDKTIMDVPAGSGGVIFLPYLAGERGVRSDPYVRGSFTGISLATTRKDLLRAVVEGIGYNMCLQMREVKEAGVQVTRLPFVGGLGIGAGHRQIFADMLGVELLTFKHMDQAAAAGAAVLGGIGVGLFENETAADLFMKPNCLTKPDPKNHELYGKLLERFDKIYHALKPIYGETIE